MSRTVCVCCMDYQGHHMSRTVCMLVHARGLTGATATPQNDLQAQARCHRIGQESEVKIYR